MLSRNDQPYMSIFNFGIDSVFNSVPTVMAETIPILPNQFFLLDTENFNLLDGSSFLLLGT